MVEGINKVSYIFFLFSESVDSFCKSIIALFFVFLEFLSKREYNRKIISIIKVPKFLRSRIITYLYYYNNHLRYYSSHR